MKWHPWALTLAAAGLASLPAVVWCEEKPNSVFTAISATTLSGYVDTSAQWNLGTGNQFTPPYAFSQGKADGFNLNVIKLSLEHPVGLEDAWSAGYKVDLIAGPDATIFNTVSPLATGPADFGVRQAYVVLHAPVGNGLDFKLGVWDTIIGYEIFDAPSNPNFTHSYGYTIEPTTHTGLLGTYQVSEALLATLGVADTVGPSINQRAFPAKAESYKTYLGGLTFTMPTNSGWLSGSTLCACVINGFNGGTRTSPTAFDQTSWYVGGTVNTPVSGLKVGASYDYLGISRQPLSGPAYANALALYLSYLLTEKLILYGRAEYASTDIPATAYTTVLGAREVVALTTTLQYDLWKNVISRLEFRWDHAASGGPAYGGVNAGDPPSKDNSFILLVNLIYKF